MELTKRCPYCAEEIHAEAIRCKHCHADLAAIFAERSERRGPERSSFRFLPIAGLVVLGTAAVLAAYFWIQNHPYPLTFVSTPNAETGGNDVKLEASIPGRATSSKKARHEQPENEESEDKDVASAVRRLLNERINQKIAQRMKADRAMSDLNAADLRNRGHQVDPAAADAALEKDEATLRSITATVDGVQIFKLDDLNFIAIAHFTSGNTETYNARLTDGKTQIFLEPRR